MRLKTPESFARNVVLGKALPYHGSVKCPSEDEKYPRKS